MDPYGGNNPSSPRLDSTPVPPQQQPASTAPATSPAASPLPSAPMAPTIPTPVTEGSSPAANPLGAPPSNLGGMGDLGISSESKGPIGGKGKIVVFIAIGGVLLVSIAAGAFFVGNKSGISQGQKLADAAYQKKEAERQRQEAENNTEEEESAELDLGSDLVEPEYKDENVEGDIGKQLTSSDGLILKVTNIERNFKTDDPNYKLDATKELIKVNFLMGNIAKDKVKDVTNFAFYLQNSTEARLTPESIVSYTDKFDTVKLDPGSQSKGSIVYLVNKDEKPLKFIREQRYRFAGENREVTTRTIINVAE